MAAANTKNLPKNPTVNGTPASESMATSIAKASHGERLPRPLKLRDIVAAGGIGDHDDDHETQQRHQQITGKVERDRRARNCAVRGWRPR